MSEVDTANHEKLYEINIATGKKHSRKKKLAFNIVVSLPRIMNFSGFR